MGETRYPLGSEKHVRFGYDDYRYGCLCTFPFNYRDHKLSISTVESFALMGAALCMYQNGGLENESCFWDNEYVLPDCLPLWVRNEIRRILGDYPEHFEPTDCIPIDSLVNEDELYKKNLKKIRRWAGKELKRLKNTKTEEDAE